MYKYIHVNKILLVNMPGCLKDMKHFLHIKDILNLLIQKIADVNFMPNIMTQNNKKSTQLNKDMEYYIFNL